MSNSAKLGLCLCQGVGGLSESQKAGYRVSDFQHMRATMRTRQGTYHLSPVWDAPRPSQPQTSNSTKLGLCLWQGVGGVSES